MYLISNWKYGIHIVFKLHRMETISPTHNTYFAHHCCMFRLPQLSNHQAAQRIMKRNYLHESYGQVLSVTKDAGHKRSQTKEVFLQHLPQLRDWCTWYENCNQLSHMQLLIIHFASVQKLNKNGNTIRQCISCLYTSRKHVIQLGGRCSVIFLLTLTSLWN
jgi:hypothetical protein